jgi:DNA repair photolyase
VRWEQQTVENEAGARLPGYRDVTVRHFDAPEAVDTRFYEVEAKSILNQVPPSSQMPFRWTINPYRGCTHACSYCLWGQTRVLLADGRHKPIADLDVGDRIYGSERSGRNRRYIKTEVLDKWMTVKPAYRVVLADGTELITSGDHRFLSDRGWKHVVNSSAGLPDRPHLTTSNHLIGTGAFAPQPVQTREYRRGYLSGVIRSDGTIEPDSYERPARSAADVHRFRLALTDIDALRRARDFLDREDLVTGERVFQRAAGDHREVRCIYGSRGSFVERVRQIIDWPVAPSLDWCCGFLAGVFDAGGSCGAYALRIANVDPQMLSWIDACARRLGFDAVRDRTENEHGLTSVRIRGGLASRLRFLHLTDPAITRKRSIEGQIVKPFADLKVEAIEPLGRALPLYDITTGTGDFIANGVVSHNCFARPTHKYLDFNAGRDFEREIVVKVNAPELLRAELARPSWEGEHVALGTNTDPYQWVEGRYKLMVGIWEAMRDAGNPCSILTKSPLLLRDLPIMKEIAERTDFSAALSIPTLDERAWRATEPHTPNPNARLEALAELTRAGITTGVLVAPLMPGVNDAPEQVQRIVDRATEAGASYVTGIALHLRGDVKGLFFEWLEQQRPDLLPRYRQLYKRGAYAPQEERRRLAALVRGPDLPPGERMRGARRDPPARASPPRASEQRTLF